MNIFKTIWATLYNRGFYEQAKSHTLGRVIGYYAKLSLLLGLAAAIFALAVMSPKLSQGMKEMGNSVLAAYPDDLAITVTKGQVTTNAPAEPVVIPMPSPFKEEKMRAPGSKGLPQNLVVIDTSRAEAIGFDEFKQYDTAIFIGKDYVISHDKNNSIAYRDLSEVPDFTVNESLLQKIIGYTGLVWIILPIMFFVGVFLGTFLTLIYILLLALITWLASYILGQRLTYGESYKITTYASTWPSILVLVLAAFSPRVPFLFTLLTLISVIVNIPAKGSQVPTTGTPSAPATTV